MKILVVEDNPTVAQTLQLLLSSYHYAVDLAADGEAGLQMAEVYEYSLVLLDIMLPRLDGISLCQQLRSQGFRAPILLLTGKGGGHQKAIALNAGADDYVVKPFDAEELIARVQALLRRGGPNTEPILTWGDLAIDPNSRKVTYGTHLLTVTPKEYAILELFIRQNRRVFSARALLDHLWEASESPGDEAIRVHIKELRKKLKAAGAPKDFIKTVYRAGYRLNSAYSAALIAATNEPLSPQQIAELRSANEELRATVAKLQSTQTELQQKNQALAIAYRHLEKEVHHLRAAQETHLPEPEASDEQSDALIRTVIEALPDLLLRVARDGTCLGTVHSQNLANDFYPLVQQHLSEVLPPDLLQRQLNAVEQALTTGSLQVYEHELTREGRTVSEEVRVAAIAPDEALIIVRNISDRKQSEVERLHAEQTRQELRILEQILDTVLAGYWDWDIPNHQEYLSPGFKRMFGYEDHELLNTPDSWQSLIFPEDLHKVQESFNRHVQSQGQIPYYNEVRYRHKQGSTVWVLCSGQVIEWDEAGNPLRMVGCHIDISDRKAAEITIQNSEDLFRSLFEQSILGIAFSRLDTQIPRPIRVNQKLCEMLGYSEAELLSMTFVDIVHPEDLAASQKTIQQLRESRNSNHSTEKRYVCKDGHFFWARTSISLLKGLSQYPDLKAVLIEDITDRKQLELKLQESQKTLSEVFDSAIAGIIRLRFYPDTSIQYDYISPHCEKNFGYTVAELMPDANLWRSRIHPDDWNTIIVPTMQSLLSQREPSTHVMEYRFQRKDGSICWILANIFAQWNKTGQYWNVTVVDTDISDRKRTEEALRESEARWQFALEGAEDGVWDWNAQTDTVFYSRQWKTMLGYAEADVGDRFEDWDSRVHPEDRVQAYAALDKHIRGETPLYQNEHRMRCRDGSYKWILTRGKVIERTPEGAPRRIIGIHTDVSDRRLAEQKIREQAALIDIATDAIFVQDLEHRIVFWSRGAEQLYGWTKTEALGQFTHELFGREAAADLETRLTSVIAKGDWQGELQRRTKSGNPLLVASRWTLVRDTTGQSQSLLVVDSDITEKKQLEAQFHQAQRLESLGRLASGIAHDLNNVLTPILTVVQLLRLTQQNMGADTQAQLNLLEESAEQGANLVKQILAFTRGEDEEQSPINLIALLKNVINIAQQSFPKSIEFCQNFSPSKHPDRLSIVVLANATHLNQVFMNLCINARDAMPEGGILTITVATSRVDEAVARKNWDAQIGEYVVVTVADTGTGIAPQIRDRIFDPFFTTKAIGQGTGLGLSTVLGIVKNYGGFLQVTSEVGQGTRVEVYLPTTTVPPSHENSSREEPLGGKGELILVVDDDATVRQSTEFLLKSYRYTTLGASDGAAAIALYTQYQDDIRLIILDVMMPHMDGIQLVHRLHAVNPSAQIIAISGLPANRDAVLATGVEVFLAKPYAPEALLEAVAALVTSRD
ncbi:MAG: PAS domain S-box protein [Leptolyngbyaceae cyanobacterium]